MARPIDTALTGDIWHLSIDDLFAPLPETIRLGGSGPFVINLSASSAPIDVPAKGIAGCEHVKLYQLQRIEDRRPRYRLRVGPFATEDEADEILKTVRDIYPGALTATADGEDLRVIANLQPKAAPPSATPPAAAKPAVVPPSVLLAPPPIAVRPAAAVAPRLAVVKPVAAIVPPPVVAKAAAAIVPPPVVAKAAPAIAPPPTVAKTAAAIVPPPAAAKPAAVVAPAAMVPPVLTAEHHFPLRPSAAKAAAAIAPPPAAAKPAAAMAPPQAAAKPAAAIAPPQAAAKPAAAIAPPQTAAKPAAAMAAPQTAAKPLAAVALRTLAPVRPPAAKAPVAPPPPREVLELSAPLPRLESTQTVRALTQLELEDEQASRWFVIQLSLSDQAFDPDTVPNLDIFNVYRLYSVAGIDQGRIVHALRLGFFTEEIAASAVASYLAEFYDKPAIKRVSSAERQRFAEQPLEARKDVGATGKQAVIEITNERYIRERRAGQGAGKSNQT